MRNQALSKIAFGPLAVLALHIIASLAGWYELFWWLDIPVHFLGGVAITFSMIIVLKDFQTQGKFNSSWTPLTILILLAFAALAAVGWELFEFACDAYLHTHTQTSVLDSIKDICMGLMGGGLVAILTSLKSKKP